MDNATFVYSTYINSTPEKVWGALTSAEFTIQYWGGRKIITDWEIEAEITFERPDGGNDFVGKVLQYQPYTKISYTCGAPDAADTSRVTIELVQMAPSQVRLNIIHENIVQEKRKMTSEGWYAIMSSLKSLLETGKALDFSWWRG